MSNKPTTLPTTTVERVWIPLGVIVGTVSILFLFGMLLFKAGGTSASSSSTPSATESVEPTDSPAAQSTQSTQPTSKHPDVIVLNGTDVSGLAKKAADQLLEAGWPVSSTGNWAAEPLTESTIFYPEELQTDAEELAELTGAKIELADAVLAKNALTYVVLK